MPLNDKYHLLVIGGSTGSLTMVLKIVPLLKKEMNIAIILVFHRKQTEDTTLVDLLSTRTGYRVKEADDKDQITPGVIYIAPPDYHVLIEKDHSITLDDSEKINYSRPSIDVTFESAADAYGKELACLLLSGANSDGVLGLVRARDAGSFIMVQDPASAEFPTMPRSAVERVSVDLLLGDENLKDLSDLLLPESV